MGMINCNLDIQLWHVLISDVSFFPMSWRSTVHKSDACDLRYLTFPNGPSGRHNGHTTGLFLLIGLLPDRCQRASGSNLPPAPRNCRVRTQEDPEAFESRNNTPHVKGTSKIRPLEEQTVRIHPQTGAVQHNSLAPCECVQFLPFT